MVPAHHGTVGTVGTMVLAGTSLCGAGWLALKVATHSLVQGGALEEEATGPTGRWATLL